MDAKGNRFTVKEILIEFRDQTNSNFDGVKEALQDMDTRIAAVERFRERFVYVGVLVAKSFGVLVALSAITGTFTYFLQ